MRRNGPVLLALALAACKPDPASGSLDGPTIFAEACARCHGPTGRPTEQLVQQLGVKDLTASELPEKITPALVLHQVKTGSENRIMPSFAGALSAAQMEAVAKYVASPDFMRGK